MDETPSKYIKTITAEEIDDIMDSAMRGIAYWAGEAQVVGEYLGDYASEQISRGGSVRIWDNEGEKWHTLTKDKLLSGLSLYTGSLEPTEIDDYAADTIVQLALFGKEVYA